MIVANFDKVINGYFYKIIKISTFLLNNIIVKIISGYVGFHLGSKEFVIILMIG
ncbi:hypothetical protein GA0061094_1479 [[Bacillus] enclensis]|jgi:hypothetical protein|uniref:Uncharacterized protein n=1 Tax=[Bacillus] enclensis TaxID=1402860 RepID=A0A1C4AEE9_9BACI|nr:hypothetical protein GA0061094_1479 [[Bacillus] enclensis]